MMSTVFLILTLVVTAYTVAVMASILSTWAPGLFHGKIMRTVHRMTQPFLGLFQRIKFLRIGGMDFSVIPALLVLQMFIQVFYALATQNIVTFALVLALLVTMIFSSVQFILVFFFVLSALRVIGMALGSSSVNPLWMTLDRLLQPVIYPIMRRIIPQRSLPYGTALAVFSAGLILLWILLGIVSGGLVALCQLIPF